MKIWYIFCFLFCLYNIHNLFNERYASVFVKEGESYEIFEKFNFLICFELESLFSKKSFIHKKANLTLEELSSLTFKAIEGKTNGRKLAKLRKIISNAKKTLNFKFFNYQVCLILEDPVDAEYVIDNFFAKTVCLMFKENPFIMINYCILLKQYNQIKVENLEYPYSKCRKQMNGVEKYSRFMCFNNCFKNNVRRSLRFMYDSSETGLVVINDRNGLNLEHDQHCRSVCEYHDCESFILDYPYSKINSKFFKAYSSLTTFEFLLQLIGLICLFTGLTFVEQIFVLIRSCFILHKKCVIKTLEKYYEIANRPIIFLSFISIVIVFTEMITTYKGRLENAVVKESVNFLAFIDFLNIVICVPADQRFKTKYDHNFGFLTDDDSKFTFNELENLTNNALNDTLDDIYIDYGSRKRQINFIVSSKVYFMRSIYFYRCFKIEVQLTRRKIDSLIMISKLIIKFKKGNYELYLMPEDQMFELKTLCYSFNKFGILKKKYPEIKLIKKHLY